MSKADHITTTTDDPAILRAMIAERDAEIDRLQHIIVAMQRHRFGKKAETLPTDQLLLALEDVEQVEAEGLAREERRDCQEFRVWACILGLMEISHGTTERPGYPGRHP